MVKKKIFFHCQKNRLLAVSVLDCSRIFPTVACKTRTHSRVFVFSYTERLKLQTMASLFPQVLKDLDRDLFILRLAMHLAGGQNTAYQEIF